MTKQELQDICIRLCATLADLGFEFEVEADNRSDRKSHYVYVRRPRYLQIRISDHPRGKAKRKKMIDIGPHGTSLEEAVKELSAMVPR